MGVISDSVAGAKVKRRIRYLEREKKDLLDDGGSVRALNRGVDAAIADVHSYLGEAGGARIVSKLESYREPEQCADACLSTARACVEREITYWKRRLEDADAKYCGGGGGSDSFGSGSGGGSR